MKRVASSPPRAPASTTSWLASRSRGKCPPGAVLLHAPSFVFQAPGGGENQLIQTGRHLEEVGVPVRLFSGWTDRLEDGPAAPSLRDVARGARAGAGGACGGDSGRAVADLLVRTPRLAALERHPVRKLASLAAWGLRCIAPAIPSWRRELLRLADLVLPNSRSEATQLVRLFGVARERIRVVPNGVLPSTGLASPELFRQRWRGGPFVLSVGRIEPRKNTLGLIRAMGPLVLPLVLIGEAPPGHRRYEEECRRAGRDGVVWLGRLDHHDPLLASAYAAARVFALPSWFETPGLAALEAALAGCSVVITPFGSTREYFGDHVEYARPNRVAEIRRAVSKCWDDGPDPRLARLIASRYLWPTVARITAEVYDQAGF